MEYPHGVVNLLSGDPPAIASQLISSDIIKKISVTGSTRVGKIILKQAADKVTKSNNGVKWSFSFHCI